MSAPIAYCSRCQANNGQRCGICSSVKYESFSDISREACVRHLRRLLAQGWTREQLIAEAAQWIADYGAPKTNGGDPLSATQLVACVDPPTRQDFYGFGSSVEVHRVG